LNLHAFRQRVLNPPCIPLPATPAHFGGRGNAGRPPARSPRRRRKTNLGAPGGNRTRIPRLRGESSSVELPGQPVLDPVGGSDSRVRGGSEGICTLIERIKSPTCSYSHHAPGDGRLPPRFTGTSVITLRPKHQGRGLRSAGPFIGRRRTPFGGDGANRTHAPGHPGPALSRRGGRPTAFVSIMAEG
jgi:hypothetical protein